MLQAGEGTLWRESLAYRDNRARIRQQQSEWVRSGKTERANSNSSLPGLTRQSIVFEKSFLRRKMDARVKPAHDGAR